MKFFYYLWCLFIILKPQIATDIKLSNKNLRASENSKNFSVLKNGGTLSHITSLVQLNLSHQSTVFRNIETLAEVLKKNVEMLRTHKEKKVDIVFLIDASFSVGDKNFNSELKFVRKLLADFTVSLNDTRVAVITFSDKVARHIDHISVPSEEYHKCNLLQYDFHRINFLGGNTYTLGALVEAQSVLEWSRAGAVKAVFLITDGFSNGGDPEPVANILKNNETFIFTFGIHSGNTKELQSISSSPLNEFSYLLESFDQLEALARRALHQDLSVGSFQILKNSSLCDSLCSNEEREDNGCCDLVARCSCGTVSGHYSCLCPPGYYGSGLQGSCSPCPNGTHHSGLSPGDESVCVPCPDPNHITVLGSAVSKASCFCKRGFVAKGNSCEVITCPRLYPPEHGYFVKGQGTCPNVFNAACGMRCKAGYSLHGTSIRLCQENGTWSGKPPRCIVKMCPNLGIPEHGYIKCSHESTEPNDALNGLIEQNRILVYQYPVDTICEFSCRAGSVLIGSKRRVCLPLARWDGLKTFCKPVVCPALPKLAHGFITPSECTKSGKLPFGQVCNITCGNGYQLMGPSFRRCGGKGGHWSLKSNSSKCLDVESPHITCPSNVKVSNLPGKSFAVVRWSLPLVSDNSGKAPLVWTLPVTTQPMNVPLGVTSITYIALDASLNQASCTFNITVIDTEAPSVHNCNSPSPIYLIASNRSSFVAWTPPEFHDNSQIDVTIHSSHQFGEFPLGKTQVKVTGVDWANNNSTCVIDVVVKAQPCSLSPPKIPHGTITCRSENQMLSCTYSCHKGYNFDSSININFDLFNNLVNGSLLFTCNPTGSDVMKFPNIEDLPFCSEIISPISLSQQGALSAYGNVGSCEDSGLIKELKNSIVMSLSKHSMELCRNTGIMECFVLDANASCEEVLFAVKEKTNTVHYVESTTDYSKSMGSFFNLRDSKLMKRSYVTHEGKVRWLRQSGVQHTSQIQVNFNVLAELQRALEKASNPSSKLLHSDSFSQLKNSFHKTGFVLPQRVEFGGISWKGSPQVVCIQGSVPIFPEVCLKCSPGSFFSNQTQKCHSCPVGQFQEDEGQFQCISCPHGMSTKLVHSRSIDDCQYLCAPGSFGHINVDVFSGTGAVAPCTLCAPGSYQPNYGAVGCFSCPYHDLLTSRRGAKSEKECGKSVPDESSLFPQCRSTLCQNGGSCGQTADGYLLCHCLSGFYGSLCELVVNSCDSNPCLHDAMCIPDTFSSYTCLCPSGFIGVHCEEEVNECSSNPCYNNASCEDLMHGFYCDCPPGIRGARCEEVINNCVDNPCGLFGQCQNYLAGYNCSCLEGYSGNHCELLATDSCFSAVCLNGASCHSVNHTTYECECPPQWSGRHCEIERNGCLSSPCLNNSTCVKNQGQMLVCQCQPSFTGNMCQTHLSFDYILHFPASSVTDYAVVNFPSENLSQISVCLWLQSTDGINYGTAFSYAIESEFNTLTLTDYNGFVLYINGARVVTDVTANDGEWHHFCVLWQSIGGMWTIYVDGLPRINGSELSANKMIKGSGKFILGQEQDGFGGNFSESESLIGRIYRLNVWNYTLHPVTIFNLARECYQNIDGSVISWADFSLGVRGKIKIENSSFCSDCPTPPSLWRGTVNVTKTEMGSLASYVCEKGFVFHQNKRPKLVRKCLKHGSWEGSNPSCVRRSCGFPGYLPGGTFIGRSFLYTDKIIYMCHSGYQIIGNVSRVCEASGKWSGIQPICKGHACSVLISPQNGQVVLTEMSSHMQTASFFCNPGFYLDGAEKLQCMLDGTWDESAPNCLRTKCPSPPDLENAVPMDNNSSTFEYEDKVLYVCKKHFVIVPSEGAIICGPDGSWVPIKGDSLPECKSTDCSKPVSLRHGIWTSKEKLEITSSEQFSVSSVIEAKCDPDYKLDGPFSKKCQEYGDWSPSDVSQCVKVTCDTEALPYDVPNSHLHFTGEEVGDTVTLTCKDGFQMTTANISNISKAVSVQTAKSLEHISSFSWVCSRHGSWELTESIDVEDVWLACLLKEVLNENINCSTPKAPAFGYILSDLDLEKGSLKGSIVNVRCRPGYILEGPSISICHHNGTWTDLASVQCRPVQCLTPPHFPNMIVKSATAVGSRMEFGNMMIFACVSGFRAQGDLSVRCQANGHWSPMRGLCQISRKSNVME